MWVKGKPFHFNVYIGSQKNLISAKVVKQLGFLTTPVGTREDPGFNTSTLQKQNL
jgi:hypothetical protein